MIIGIQFPLPYEPLIIVHFVLQGCKGVFALVIEFSMHSDLVFVYSIFVGICFVGFIAELLSKCAWASEHYWWDGEIGCIL